MWSEVKIRPRWLERKIILTQECANTFPWVLNWDGERRSRGHVPRLLRVWACTKFIPEILAGNGQECSVRKQQFRIGDILGRFNSEYHINQSILPPEPIEARRNSRFGRQLVVFPNITGMKNLEGSCSFKDLLERTEERPNTLYSFFPKVAVDCQRATFHPV